MSKKRFQNLDGNENGKTPFYKRWWSIALVATLAVGTLSACGDDSESVDQSTLEDVDAEESTNKETAAEEQARKEAEAEAARIAAEEEKVKKEAEAKKEAAEEQARKEAEEAAKAPLTLTGSGDAVTETFELKYPFSIITASDSGTRNFIVRMHNIAGDNSDGLINEIGPYSGEQFKNHSPGEYRLEVQSDGDWEVTFDPSIPSEGESSPITGSGDQVVFLEIDSGSYILNASDDGSSNFIVRVNDSKSLVNEIGPYTGQSIANFQDSGIYALTVISEGNWSLEFTE